MLAVFGNTAGFADVYQIDDHGTVQVRLMSGAVQWTATDGEPDAGGDPVVPDDAMTRMTPPMVPDVWRATLLATADRYDISPNLLAALVQQESRWHAEALSPKGALGLAQLMPATARALAVDAHDPAANLAGGALYLRRMLDKFDGDVERALAAYNAGPGRVVRANGVPPIAETRAYVSSILLHLAPADTDPTGYKR